FVFHRRHRKLRKALRIAERDLPARRYPPGTILQLFPFEAMVKRGGRFNPEGDGWEFFRLSVTPAGTRPPRAAAPTRRTSPPPAMAATLRRAATTSCARATRSRRSASPKIGRAH